MRQDIIDFINTKRTCVLAVEMPDGSPHAATVHFAIGENPLIFYFETHADYRKSEPLHSKEKTRASIVIGTDESVMKTLQFDGEASLITPEEKEEWTKVYLSKFPEKEKKSGDPKVVFFKFIPTWWRFTDWTRSEGKLILTSQEADFKL